MPDGRDALDVEVPLPRQPQTPSAGMSLSAKWRPVAMFSVEKSVSRDVLRVLSAGETGLFLPSPADAFCAGNLLGIFWGHTPLFIRRVPFFCPAFDLSCWARLPHSALGTQRCFVLGKSCFLCWACPAVFRAGHGLAGRFLFCASCGPTAVRHLKRRLQRRFGPCFQNRFILREKSFILRARFGVSANFFSKNTSCKHNTLQLHPTVFSKKMKKICAGHIFSGQKSLPTGEGAVFLAHSVGTRRFFWGWMLPTATGQHTVFVDFFVFKIKRLGQ